MAEPSLDPHAPDFTRRYANLAGPRIGAQVVSCSDEFFAPRERLLSPKEPVFIAGKYDDHGEQSLIKQSVFWSELLAPHKLAMDAEHRFDTLAELGRSPMCASTSFPTAA